jgi:hypothetical protein
MLGRRDDPKDDGLNALSVWSWSCSFSPNCVRCNRHGCAQMIQTALQRQHGCAQMI